MHTISRDTLKDLLAPRQGPCLSLYQRTHRTHPDNAQDPIGYRNQVRQLGEIVGKTLSDKARDELLAPLNQLLDDRNFWRHTLDGLAVLRAPDFFRVFLLPRPVPDRAIVSDTWHIKPLLRYSQTLDRFQVLCLTRQDLHLFEGTRNELVEIELAEGIPATLQEALGDQLTPPHQQVSTYGLGPAGGPGSAMHHGHGARRDALEVDIPRFFRAVDQAIADHYSRPGGLPLVLVALPEYQGIFRGLSGNPQLVAQGLDIDPASLDIRELHARVWKIIEPAYHRETRRHIERFQAQHGTGLASDNAQEILNAALAGRVDTLLVDADRHIPGQIDVAARSLVAADPQAGATSGDDILDDLAEIVLRNGGEALVIPGGIMPGDTGLAALMRY